jgi:hypothetical protein
MKENPMDQKASKEIKRYQNMKVSDKPEGRGGYILLVGLMTTAAVYRRRELN